jgi:RNA polymerase-binding transcription factor DksA
MRRVILSNLFDHLQEHYTTGWSKEMFVDGQLSIHQIDAAIAFKSDQRLVELRNALDRLEGGTYGVCISCKGAISQAILDSDPAQRVCAACEEEISHTMWHPHESHASL